MTTKRLSGDEFIRRANIAHKNKYDYSKVVYVNGKSKVVIGCPLHGEFAQRPYNHSKGEGCPKCRLDYMRKILSSNVEKFILDANHIHNNSYCYSEVVYKNSKAKVCIKCPKHGSFWQTPNNHLRGQTCPECSDIAGGDKNRKTTAEFIEDAMKIHGGKYDYSDVNYHHKDENISIKCRTHGAFMQSPHNHLIGAGCPKCVSSKGEQKIMMLLDSKGMEYERQKMFIRCRSPKNRMLKFDFFIPSKKLLIEYDGPQHYGNLRIGKYTLKKEEYERLQVHDAIKNEYAREHGMTLVRIPHWEDKDIEKILSVYL